MNEKGEFSSISQRYPKLLLILPFVIHVFISFNIIKLNYQKEIKMSSCPKEYGKGKQSIVHLPVFWIVVIILLIVCQLLFVFLPTIIIKDPNYIEVKTEQFNLLKEDENSTRGNRLSDWIHPSWWKHFSYLAVIVSTLLILNILFCTILTVGLVVYKKIKNDIGIKTLHLIILIINLLTAYFIGRIVIGILLVDCNVMGAACPSFIPSIYLIFIWMVMFTLTVISTLPLQKIILSSNQKLGNIRRTIELILITFFIFYFLGGPIVSYFYLGSLPPSDYWRYLALDRIHVQTGYWNAHDLLPDLNDNLWNIERFMIITLLVSFTSILIGNVKSVGKKRLVFSTFVIPKMFLLIFCLINLLLSLLYYYSLIHFINKLAEPKTKFSGAPHFLAGPDSYILIVSTSAIAICGIIILVLNLLEWSLSKKSEKQVTYSSIDEEE